MAHSEVVPLDPTRKKLKTSDLPISSATRAAIEGLAHTFKKKGGYDSLRKQIWNDLTKTTFEAEFSSSLLKAAEIELEKNDYDLLRKNRATAEALIHGAVERAGAYRDAENQIDALIDAHIFEIESGIRNIRKNNVGEEVAAMEQARGGKTDEQYAEEARLRRQAREKSRREAREKERIRLEEKLKEERAIKKAEEKKNEAEIEKRRAEREARRKAEREREEKKERDMRERNRRDRNKEERHRRHDDESRHNVIKVSAQDSRSVQKQDSFKDSNGTSGTGTVKDPDSLTKSIATNESDKIMEPGIAKQELSKEEIERLEQEALNHLLKPLCPVKNYYQHQFNNGLAPPPRKIMPSSAIQPISKGFHPKSDNKTPTTTQTALNPENGLKNPHFNTESIITKKFTSEKPVIDKIVTESSLPEKIIESNSINQKNQKRSRSQNLGRDRDRSRSRNRNSSCDWSSDQSSDWSRSNKRDQNYHRKRDLSHDRRGFRSHSHNHGRNSARKLSRSRSPRRESRGHENLRSNWDNRDRTRVDKYYNESKDQNGIHTDNFRKESKDYDKIYQYQSKYKRRSDSIERKNTSNDTDRRKTSKSNLSVIRDRSPSYAKERTRVKDPPSKNYSSLIQRTRHARSRSLSRDSDVRKENRVARSTSPLNIDRVEVEVQIEIEVEKRIRGTPETIIDLVNLEVQAGVEDDIITRTVIRQHLGVEVGVLTYDRSVNLEQIEAEVVIEIEIVTVKKDAREVEVETGIVTKIGLEDGARVGVADETKYKNKSY
ncbi:hypothetical protein BGHDH14_bgh05810 [Blumeria hordei DH14]|uniref:BOD1/SHG1 domain-containing protein n=1 Tax=Blumeria graminis f. sp. hordei (strain DH14) TaxID=546991 RepID=N1JBF1_BLUG1|nr:hypothetical protein BGHDH14_bgh05810 [Blumeria hordei DH14]